jgi:lipoprotein-anchoring transpeptidase ErfK/SrfK
MSGVILDRRNWIFLIALIPALLVGLFALRLPDRSASTSHAPAPLAAPAAPDAAAPPAAQATAGTPRHARTSTKPAAPKPDFSVKTALQIDRPLAPGEYVWDDSGVADGRVAIVVDVKNELLYVYRGGHEIGRSTLIYGDDDKPTPLGIFPILEKDADHHSKTYGGAPMPHMLRLTHDGVALHGSRFIHPDYATHGCIGLPKEFAAILFDEAKIGDYVKVTRGWTPGEK